jgi:hypothetical protein
MKTLLKYLGFALIVISIAVVYGAAQESSLIQKKPISASVDDVKIQLADCNINLRSAERVDQEFEAALLARIADLESQVATLKGQPVKKDEKKK